MPAPLSGGSQPPLTIVPEDPTPPWAPALIYTTTLHT